MLKNDNLASSSENEELILVDQNDNDIGFLSKSACHAGEGVLHRAFSVILFNINGELLLQKRSALKKLWPMYWSNSCCSHPLYQNGEENGIEGAKSAAIRKLTQELGIEMGSIKSENMNFVTKMHYKARADKKWVEHEIDYIFVVKRDVQINPNSNEIQKTNYVNKKELDNLFKLSNNDDVKIGPWFKLIREHFLDKIWENLESLKDIEDKQIHHMGEVN